MAMIMAKQGAKITVVDINMEGAKETVKKIKDENGEAACFKCDVTSIEGTFLIFNGLLSL